MLHISHFSCLIFSWWICLEFIKEAGTQTVIGNISKNTSRAKKNEVVGLLTEEWLTLPFCSLQPCFPNLSFPIQAQGKPSQVAASPEHTVMRGHPWLLAVLLGNAVGRMASPACTGVDKLSTKLQKEKHFAFFCKTVLGEIRSSLHSGAAPRGNCHTEANHPVLIRVETERCLFGAHQNLLAVGHSK